MLKTIKIDYKKLYILKCSEIEQRDKMLKKLGAELETIKKGNQILHNKKVVDKKTMTGILESFAISIIQEENNRHDVGDAMWNDSKYKRINELKANNVGNVGEKLLQKICEFCEIVSCIDGSKTKQYGGG